MAADIIHDGSFQEGFEVGYRAIKGKSVMMPMTPMAPMTPMSTTTFLLGVRKGLEKALGRSISDLKS